MPERATAGFAHAARALDLDTFLVEYRDDLLHRAIVDRQGVVREDRVVTNALLSAHAHAVIAGADQYLLLDDGAGVSYQLVDGAGQVVTGPTTIVVDGWIEDVDATWNGHGFDVTWSRAVDGGREVLLARIDGATVTAPVVVAMSPLVFSPTPRAVRTGAVTWVVWTGVAGDAVQALGVRVDDRGGILDAAPFVLRTGAAVLDAASLRAGRLSGGGRQRPAHDRRRAGVRGDPPPQARSGLRSSFAAARDGRRQADRGGTAGSAARRVVLPRSARAAAQGRAQSVRMKPVQA